jgi:hypothetical protein
MTALPGLPIRRASKGAFNVGPHSHPFGRLISSQTLRS